MDTFLEANIVHLWTSIVNSDLDPLGEELQKISWTSKQFLLPNVLTLLDHFIIVPLKKSIDVIKYQKTKDLEGLMIHHPQMFQQLKQLDHKALWASSEVINTMANIEWTTQIICKITSILGKYGINIAITM